jgi:hypothetical protein
MSRAFRITLLLLLLAVLAGVLEIPSLRLQLLGPGRQEQSDEEARREVIRPLPEGPQFKKEKAFIFWLSAETPGTLVPIETLLPLGPDPMQRARTVLEALIADAPSPEQRVLPVGAALQAFYLLPDGTAVADFSDALSHEMPSGISSEQRAVDAITATLHAAVPQARRLRILIDGQEVETLAGHVDLTSAFDLSVMTPFAPAPSAQGPASPPQGAVSATPPSPSGKKAAAPPEAAARQH